MTLPGYIFLIAVIAFQTESNTDSPIQNGDFEDWKSGVPVGWELGEGATTGDSGVESKVKKGKGPSLQIHGTGKTTYWHSVSQSVDVKKNHRYFLRFQVRGKNLKHEQGQYNNCFVGVFLENGGGQVLQKHFIHIDNGPTQTYVLPFQTDAKCKSAKAMIFLSKTGQLNVRGVQLYETTLENSFDVLVADMDRNYSYFKHKKIDWEQLTDKYRAKANAAKSPEEFVDVVTDMLAEMKDTHTWVMHDGKMVTKTKSQFEPNFDFEAVDSDLKNTKRIGNYGLIGTTPEGYGYVRITSLSGINERVLGQLTSTIRKRFDAPGIILDLRRNSGGSEILAQKIAGMFVEKEIEYAKNRFRAGPEHDNFVERTRQLPVEKGAKYLKPVVCLIGPGAVSSAEGFAMMMKAIPTCQIIGQPTRGASGNPAPVQLANGIDVYYSRWMSLLPDGTPIEDAGVPPDEEIEHVPGSDKTYERAKEVLGS